MTARIPLPPPQLKGGMSLEEAIRRRRSRRDFTDAPLTMEQLAQLLWACQGVTGERPTRRGPSRESPPLVSALERAAPSAGATFPMEIFVAVGARTAGDLDAGLYHYHSAEHALQKTFDGDVRPQIAAAALGQDFLESAPVVILMAAESARTSRRYGERADRYVAMEAGHIGQNVYLQAEALGLGTVAVGAFHDEQVAAAFRLPKELKPVYVMPVGSPARP